MLGFQVMQYILSNPQLTLTMHENFKPESPDNSYPGFLV